jgi:hypothetical protein
MCAELLDVTGLLLHLEISKKSFMPPRVRYGLTGCISRGDSISAGLDDAVLEAQSGSVLGPLQTNP